MAGFPGGSVVKSLPAMWETWGRGAGGDSEFDPWVRKIP